MADETQQTHFGFRTVGAGEKAGLVRSVFDSVASRYDLMNDLMSLGVHRLWKRFAIELAGVRPGQRVLDLASGTGDLADRFADLVGPEGLVLMTDINAAMLGVGRDRMTDRGHAGNVAYAQVDAESLPFADDSFDRVTSVFGVMFAPNQQRAADELRRVCRPGGRIVTCAWTPSGLNGQMFGLIGASMPPPPEGFQPPVLWGTEERVSELFAGDSTRFETLNVPFEDDSIEEWMARNERILGPTVMAKEVLEQDGKWGPLREQLTELYADANEATDGSMHVEAEYLLAAIDVG